MNIRRSWRRRRSRLTARRWTCTVCRSTLSTRTGKCAGEPFAPMPRSTTKTSRVWRRSGMSWSRYAMRWGAISAMKTIYRWRTWNRGARITDRRKWSPSASRCVPWSCRSARSCMRRRRSVSAWRTLHSMMRSASSRTAMRFRRATMISWSARRQGCTTRWVPRQGSSSISWSNTSWWI